MIPGSKFLFLSFSFKLTSLCLRSVLSRAN
jgi:hypothetical protein